MPRSTTIVILAATLLAACGARSSFDANEGATDGSGGAAATGGAPATGGEGGGQGGADAPFICPVLQWAGDPVFIDLPFGNAIDTPRLVLLGNGDVALTFDAIADAIGHTLGSVPIVQPFARWPPAAGPADLNFPSQHRFAVTTGQAPAFAFAASDSVGSLALGEAIPGENGSTFAAFPSGAFDVQSVARNALDEHVVVTGASLLVAEGFSSSTPLATQTTLSVLGCADVAHGAVVPRGPRFVAASASDLPFDDCIDPDIPGPPTFVQTYGFEATGDVEQGDVIDTNGVVRQLLLASNVQGTWLGHALDDATLLEVRKVADDLTLAADPITFVTESTSSQFALAASGPTLAVAAVVPEVSSLTVSIVVDASLVSLASTELGVIPRGTPSVMASEDGRSILVAVLDEASFATIALLRADCLDTAR